MIHMNGISQTSGISMRFVSGSAVSSGLALAVVMMLSAACETSGDGTRPDAGAASRGTAAPIAGRVQPFPRPAPRPESDVFVAAPQSGPAATAEGAAGPAVHTVAPGENVYDIARKYDVDAYAIVMGNELRPPFDLKDGQVLIIPGSAPMTASAPAPTQSAADRSPAAEQPADPGSRATAGREAGSERAALSRAEPDVDAPASKEGFIWPVTGRIVSSYGSKGAGRYNDGINIAAPEGTVVRAAASGVVAYAGNELRGFGRTLLIKHPGGWVTAYAHNSQLLVQRGEKVRRGQAIARVGLSGGVDQAQLHFEIRQGRNAVDPVKLLPRASATARHGRVEG
jgi:murein DD-endopeptidase MepM/ murein hydrolase activator NlpD